MSLINFGSILSFAEEIEKQNMEFFIQASANPVVGTYKTLFEDLTKNAKKRIIETQRIRRENVTEMVLEAVEGLHRDSFIVTAASADNYTLEQVIKKSQELMDRSIDYYDKASKKLKSQADVARALKTLAKKNSRDRKRIELNNENS